jgi:hypothetical protein
MTTKATGIPSGAVRSVNAAAHKPSSSQSIPVNNPKVKKYNKLYRLVLTTYFVGPAQWLKWSSM